MRYTILVILVLFSAGCAHPPEQRQPRRWTMENTLILEVPGEGAYFPPKDGVPALIIVRDISDPLVVPHEAGHAVWQAAGQRQVYP